MKTECNLTSSTSYKLSLIACLLSFRIIICGGSHILVGFLNRKEFLPDPYVMIEKTFILMGVMHMEYVEHYMINMGQWTYFSTLS